MRLVIGGDQHTGSPKIIQPRDEQRPVGDAVGAAVLDLQAWRAVVEAVGQHVIGKMAAFEHIVQRDVVIAGDQPPAPDAEGGAGAGDEGVFAAGDVLA